MELILKQDVQNVGFKDDIVTVKAGYGRNYLIPQGFATLSFSLLLSAQDIACLSKLTVKKRITLSSRLNSVSKAINTSGATWNSNKW